MKVRDVASAAANVNKRVGTDNRTPEPVQGMTFRGQMTNLTQEAHMQRMTQLAQQITEQGQLVAKRADIKELQRYREMISELINETVSNSFSFNKSGTFDARGRHRVFAVINKVNVKLDELTQEVLKEEADNLTMLDMVDDIRGLLVDMLL